MRVFIVTWIVLLCYVQCDVYYKSPLASDDSDLSNNGLNGDTSVFSGQGYNGRSPSALCGSVLEPLGMQSGAIKNSQIAASSSHSVMHVGPQFAR